jgi:hypothetical protein
MYELFARVSNGHSSMCALLGTVLRNKGKAIMDNSDILKDPTKFTEVRMHCVAAAGLGFWTGDV